MSCCAPASVTETIANRGSTGSLKTSATCFGGVLTSTLAAGTVRSSAACDHAAAGSGERDRDDRAGEERAPHAPRA